MTLLCSVLIVLALLVGYLLGRTASEQPDYSSQLEAIQSAIEELKIDLCGEGGAVNDLSIELSSIEKALREKEE